MVLMHVQTLQLPYSKSISNRLLMLKYLYAPALEIRNLSDAKDTRILKDLLEDGELPIEVNVQDAGTVARFVTTLACISGKEHRIMGTARMHKRPMGELIRALRHMGAKLLELGEENCLPLQVLPASLKAVPLTMSTEKSSQFLSALMMMAPFFPDGGRFNIIGSRNSWSYVKMTEHLMQQLGLRLQWKNEELIVYHFEGSDAPALIDVEADWSSAAFFWQALSSMTPGSGMFFPDLIPHRLSCQGDSVLMNWQGLGGVYWEKRNGGMLALKRNEKIEYARLDFSDCPDLAIPVIVGLCAAKEQFSVKGIETLNLKESQRWSILLQMMGRFGVYAEESDREWKFDAQEFHAPDSLKFSSHGDHRFAMSLAVLGRGFNLEIDDLSCAEKSFPQFVHELGKL